MPDSRPTSRLFAVSITFNHCVPTVFRVAAKLWMQLSELVNVYLAGAATVPFAAP
jgi:hypothetical protein